VSESIPVAADPKNATPGRPHITLAQFVKLHQLADSGGQAKHRVRAGGITVDGTPEDRPGRKLFGGEKVLIDGKTLVVAPPEA
jgi:ribosome-associated protein